MTNILKYLEINQMRQHGQQSKVARKSTRPGSMTSILKYQEINQTRQHDHHSKVSRKQPDEAAWPAV
jgi:hypothetical protein